MLALRSINSAEPQTCSARTWLSRQACILSHRPTARLPRRHMGPVTASAPRRDLDPNGLYSTSLPYEYGGARLGQAKALTHSFDSGKQGVPISQTIPVLPTVTIKKVKAAAMNVLRGNPGTAEIATTYDRLCKVDNTSSLIHPAGLAGPAELSVMLYRIKNQQEPTNTAKNTLLSGPDDKKTKSSYKLFSTPLVYGGPYAMRNVQIDYSGLTDSRIPPPPNYPATAPKDMSAHTAFVELDGQQAYQQALAWWTTDDTRYADNALRIIDAWATTNKQWGIINRNGPLEAGWGIASMSKAVELLRFKQWQGYTQNRRGQAVYDRFVSWVTTVMLPQMDDYVDVRTRDQLKKNDPNWLGNCK